MKKKSNLKPSAEVQPTGATIANHTFLPAEQNPDNGDEIDASVAIICIA